jgi:hypothetical protein
MIEIVNFSRTFFCINFIANYTISAFKFLPSNGNDPPGDVDMKNIS